jgi:hypothetical protein
VKIRSFLRPNYILHPSAHGKAQDKGRTLKYEEKKKTNYFERIQKYFPSIAT